MTGYEKNFTCLAAVALIVLSSVIMVYAGVFEYVLAAIGLLWFLGFVAYAVLAFLGFLIGGGSSGTKSGSSSDGYEGFGSQSGW